jgi:hypothetical protein
MRKPLRLVSVVPAALAATLVACGSSTTTPTSAPSGAAATATAAPPTADPTAAATATPSAASASLTCPSQDTVNSGLGLSVDAPMSGALEDLPAGNSGIVCTYSGGATSQAFVIDLAMGPATTTSSFISLVEGGEQQAAQAQGNTYSATDLSGVGSQAAYVTVSASGSPSENGLIAISATVGLVLTAMPPLSQSQLQSFASQLLSSM